MKRISILTNRFGILETIELISALIYLSSGLLLATFVSTARAGVTMGLLMIVFIVLLFVFMKHHVYKQDKILMTLFSIYYKSEIYSVILLFICNFIPESAKDFLFVGTAVITLIYIILSYVFGRQYYQILNAFLYLCMLGFVRIIMF